MILASGRFFLMMGMRAVTMGFIRLEDGEILVGSFTLRVVNYDQTRIDRSFLPEGFICVIKGISKGF